MAARIIALACIKGGVGKTTTAASLGGILADRGKKVLLVDMDPQFNLTRTFFDKEFNDTIYEAFSRGRDIPAVNIRKNLDIVPSCPEACGIETQFLKKVDVAFILSQLLEPVRDRYDWIFVDCPAQLGIATANALVAADKFLVPMSCDAYSIDGLALIFDYAAQVKRLNRNLSPLGVFLTKFRQSRKADQHVSKELTENCSDILLDTRIRETTSLVQAALCGTDVWTYSRSSIGAKDYSALLDEILKKIRKK